MERDDGDARDEAIGHRGQVKEGQTSAWPKCRVRLIKWARIGLGILPEWWRTGRSQMRHDAYCRAVHQKMIFDWVRLILRGWLRTRADRHSADTIGGWELAMAQHPV